MDYEAFAKAHWSMKAKVLPKHYAQLLKHLADHELVIVDGKLFVFDGESLAKMRQAATAAAESGESSKKREEAARLARSMPAYEREPDLDADSPTACALLEALDTLRTEGYVQKTKSDDLPLFVVTGLGKARGYQLTPLGRTIADHC